MYRNSFLPVSKVVSSMAAHQNRMEFSRPSRPCLLHLPKQRSSLSPSSPSLHLLPPSLPPSHYLSFSSAPPPFTFSSLPPPPPLSPLLSLRYPGGGAVRDVDAPQAHLRTSCGWRRLQWRVRTSTKTWTTKWLLHTATSQPVCVIVLSRVTEFLSLKSRFLASKRCYRIHIKLQSIWSTRRLSSTVNLLNCFS